MPDEPTADRDDDDLPEFRPDGPDPEDADLIAYLDGELDSPGAADVEDRLALDSAARARAEAYKKSYDLLDYLPRREPSPDFTTRTLTKLQPLPSPSGGSAVAAGGSGPRAADPAGRPRQRSWALPLLAAAVVAAVGGFAAHASLRPYLNPPERLDLDDLQMIEHLPLYVAVDDLDYLRPIFPASL